MRSGDPRNRNLALQVYSAIASLTNPVIHVPEKAVAMPRKVILIDSVLAHDSGGWLR